MKKAAILVIIVCGVVFYFSCMMAMAGDESKQLVIKGDHKYPPFEYLNKNGEPDGFNVEIMRAVAKEMGLAISIELGPWDQVRSQIETGKIDALMGMYNTKERDKLVDFTLPHLINSYAVFVRAGSPIKSLADGKNRVILVQAGDLGHDYIIENKITGKIVSRTNLEEVLNDLSKGYADCAVISRLQGMIILKEEKISNIKPVGTPIIQRQYCMAVKEGDHSLRAKLNEGLHILKTTGKYDKIYNKWFGFAEKYTLGYQKSLKQYLKIIIPLILIIIFIFIWNFYLKRSVISKTRELGESEERYRFLIETMREGMAVQENQVFTYVNSSLCIMLGYSKEELVGQNLNILFDSENQKKIKEQMALRQQGKSRPYEVELIGKEGGKIDVIISPSSINYDGKIFKGSLATFSDITERKRAEQKMLEAKRFNEEIIAKSPVGMSIYNEAGQCISVNQAIADIKGVTRESILLENYTSEKLWKKTGLLELAKKAMETKAVQHGEIEMENKSGKKITVFYQLVPLEAGQRHYLMLMATDMTEYRKMQELIIQSEKMLSVGGLAAGMAHEINNPLSGIMQTANVMSKRLTDHDMNANRQAAEKIGINIENISEFMEERGILRMLDTINDSGQRIAETVNNMLSFSRKSEAKDVYNNLTDLVEKTLELAETDYDLKKQYDFKMIEIVKEYQKNLPLVSCEKTKIQQVLLNLFRNAAQAMQEIERSKPTLIVRVRIDDIRNMVVIEVEDNGPGISEENAHRIFEPFFTTKPTGIGTGLGLSVSYFIVTENHRGELSVESQPGKGANFIIRLPIETDGENS